MGSSFAYEDDESSSDSEEEVLQRIRRSTSSQYNTIHRQNSVKPGKYEDDVQQKDGLCNVTESRSSDRLIASCNSRDSLKKQAQSVNEVASSSTTTLKNSEVQNARGEEISVRSDLISLAEKGRVGKCAFSGASTSSETGSADTEEEALIPFLHEKAKQKAIENRERQTLLDKCHTSIKKDTSSTSITRTVKPIKHTHYENDAFDKENIAGNRCSSSASSTKRSADTPQSECQAIKCGSLSIGHAYDAPTKKLVLHVNEAQELPSKDRGGANQVQVRCVLLPFKRQKYKTKVRQLTNGSVHFNESFTFHRINPDEVLSFAIRLRLYGCERMRREHLIGETMLLFSSSKPLQHETKLWLTLEPRSTIARSDSRSDVSSLARSDSTGSTQSMQNTNMPELLIGLSYNGTTGRIQVTVIKGSQFRNVTMSRAPDSYCKLSLVSSNGQEIARSKTSIRRGQPNPMFKETFVFQVALFQLPDVTLMISVYNKRSMKRKEMIGWFSMGLNSSGEEEMAHWNDMRDTKGEQVYNNKY
ncbi:Synaptotagmin-14-like protein [Leptotrombidium deliense]|uniref:Synaptotagmin-14-like protein n=1 Tax=Leptotrombidium deliense TaxID=299467 RepID=A0A443SKC0_9ACAR|nr:Synaptotagmin-14-like protein [Leptotrombidium deliense]